MKRLLAVLLMSAAIIGVGGAAQAAQSWGTIYLYDNGATLGKAYGSVWKSTVSGDQLAVKATFTDTYANDWGVYVQSNWYFNGTFCYPAGEGAVGCSSGWYGAGYSGTSTTKGTLTETKYKPLKGTAESARAGIKLCEGRGWRPDRCTAETFRGISY